MKSDEELAAELFDGRRGVGDHVLIADEDGVVSVFVAPPDGGLVLVHIEQEEDLVASAGFLRRHGVREYSSWDEFVRVHGEPGQVVVKPIDE